MQMKIKRLLTVACSLFVAAASNAQGCKICTHIEGEVADTAVQVIRVRRVDQNNSYIYTDTIPFANGRFFLRYPHCRACRLFNLCVQ